MKPQLPGSDQRILVLGRTGSGKTVAALYQLSLRDYTIRPWIIFNAKGDKNIDAIQGKKELSLSDPIPSEPGIYVVRPLPDEEKEAEEFLWRVWNKENTGLYFDEGYLMGRRNRAFRAILTQGRSKNIPIIINSQRPVELDRFAISEADFYQVFHMNDERDRKTIEAFLPRGALDRRLPEYHSRYYSVADDALYELKPVPPAETSLAIFRRRLQELEAAKTEARFTRRKARAL